MNVSRFLFCVISFLLLSPSISYGRYGRSGVKGEDAIWYLYTFIFWAVLIFIIYISYSYKKSINKKVFLKSSIVQSFFWPVIMIFTVLIVVNLIAPKSPPKKQTSPKYDFAEEMRLEGEVKDHFKIADNTYDYVEVHFKNFGKDTNQFRILNFYYDKTLADDPEYRDVGYLGLAYIAYKMYKDEECLSDLNKISNQNLKYVNYLRGALYEEEISTVRANCSWRHPCS